MSTDLPGAAESSENVATARGSDPEQAQGPIEAAGARPESSESPLPQKSVERPPPASTSSAASEDPEQIATPSTGAARGEAVANAAAAQAQGGAPAAPYPQPPSKPAPAGPIAVQDFRVSPPRPLLGGCLSVGGVVLWSYVIVGEWVVNLKLPEVVGAFAMLAAFGLACVASVKNIASSERSLANKVIPGIGGLVLFVVTVSLAASFFGSSRRSTVAAVSVALWLLSTLSYWIGHRLTRYGRARRRGWQLTLAALLWIGSGLGTLVALVSIMARG